MIYNREGFPPDGQRLYRDRDGREEFRDGRTLESYNIRERSRIYVSFVPLGGNSFNNVVYTALVRAVAGSGFPASPLTSSELAYASANADRAAVRAAKRCALLADSDEADIADVAAAEAYLAESEAAALAAFAGQGGGPCAYTRLGEQLIDVLADVAVAGFAAELSSCRFLCNETFRIRERGAVAEVLRTAVERQCFERATGWRWSALMRAAARGDEAIARLLLDHGANADLQDVNGATALAIASACGKEGVVRLLLERGASVEPTSDLSARAWGRTALALAGPNVSVGAEVRESISRLLIERGARLNPEAGRVGTIRLRSRTVMQRRFLHDVALSSGGIIEVREFYGEMIYGMGPDQIQFRGPGRNLDNVLDDYSYILACEMKIHQLALSRHGG